MADRATYSVQALAIRWDCSRSHVYRMVERGEIESFSIGGLLRIRSSEVERIECQTMQSKGSEAVGQSSGETTKAKDIDMRSTRPVGLKPRQKRASAGISASVLNGPWERSSPHT